MLYNLKSETMLANIVQAYESAENTQRIKRHNDDYQISFGNQKDHTTRTLQERYPESWPTMVIVDLAIAGKIVRKVSRVYSGGANREVIDKDTGKKDDELTALFSYIYDDVDEDAQNFDMIMAKANKFFTNHKYAELFTYLEQGTHKLRFKVLPQHLFMALPDEAKKKAEVIVFKQEKSDFSDIRDYIDWEQLPEDFQTDEIEGIYTVWSKEENFTFVRIKGVMIEKGQDADTGEVIFRHAVTMNEKNPKGVNPYGAFPFVGIKESTEGHFYPHGSEIAHMSKEMNVVFSDLVSIAAQQGFGQAVIYYSGDKPPAITKTGPAHVINIPNRDGKSKFEFANANPDLKGHLDIALSLVRVLLTTNDLTTDKVSGELSATNFASAIDRLIADSELIDNIEDQRVKYIAAENKQFKVMMKMLQYLYDTKLWPEEYPKVSRAKLDEKAFKLKVNFNTIKPLTTEKDKASTIKQLEEDGFILPYEKHVRFSDGELGEIDAKKREEEIQKSKQERLQTSLEEFRGGRKEYTENTNNLPQISSGREQEKDRVVENTFKRGQEVIRERNNKKNSGSGTKRTERSRAFRERV